MSSKIPAWIKEWIQKDRLVRNKFKISHKYLSHKKRLQLLNGEKDENQKWISFKYMVISSKYGKYWVRYTRGFYECSCPFFKHRGICSHIFGVCQITEVWPEKEFLFPNNKESSKK